MHFANTQWQNDLQIVKMSLRHSKNELCGLKIVVLIFHDLKNTLETRNRD